MSLPSSLLTTTCDVYRLNPPGVSQSRASAAVPCQLVADYARGADGQVSSAKPWTHILLVGPSVDVRDAFAGYGNPWTYTNADTVVIPSDSSSTWPTTNTAYAVVFVEVVGKGTPGEHKRAYLDRQTPNWPTL